MTEGRSDQSAEGPNGNPGAARALFVLGAPRSGTTLIGNYLGSGPSVLNLGEYGAFHLAHNLAPAALGAIPGPYREPYLRDLVTHAQWFAEGLTATHGKHWYCDTTPWNILAADRIAADIPDALFVLMLRHYSGTIQSLRRSFESGFGWAGATWADSAEVWARAYQAAAPLPAERTLVISYEGLCADPATTLDLVHRWMDQHGFPTKGLDLGQLTISHAPPASGPRPTIAVRVGDTVELRPIASYDPFCWSGDIHRTVWPVVQEVHRRLSAQFGSAYVWPPPPSRMWIHHDVYGLVPAELNGNW